MSSSYFTRDGILLHDLVHRTRPMNTKRHLNRIRRRLAETIAPPPTMPIASKYGRSIHDGSDDKATDPRALATWDDIVRPDPSVPKQDQPMWFRKIGDLSPVSVEIADQIRERENAGYQVSFTVIGSQQKAAADLAMLRDRDALPTMFGLGNEPDLGEHMTAIEFHKQAQGLRLVDFLRRVQDETACTIANAGMSSVRHAVTDWGRMWGELLSPIPDRAIKFHSYGNLEPANIRRLGTKALIQRNCGLGPDAPVCLEEHAISFVGHGGTATAEKYDAITGERGGDWARSAMLMAAQEEVYAGHFLLDRHGINAISHPEHGLQRRLGFQKAMDVFDGGTVGTLEDLDLLDSRAKAFDVDKVLRQLGAMEL